MALLSGNREDDACQPALRIRDGAIVPLGEVVQNTTEQSLAPLTLLVSLDASGRAEGKLYEDDGDGFDHEKGDFAWSHYGAVREGSKVVVRLMGREGGRVIAPRKAVVRLLTDDGVFTAHGDLRDGVEITMTPSKPATGPKPVAVTFEHNLLLSER